MPIIMENITKTHPNRNHANPDGKGAIPLVWQSGERPCLVIGGGEVACRKALWLLECGSAVRMMSIQFTDSVWDIKRRYPEKLSLRKEAYNPDKFDLREYSLVFSACGDEEVNQTVYEQAKAANVPLNVADVPEMCDFFVPATVRRGRISIAVSTGGGCPALAGHLRRNLEEQFPEWYGELAEALNKVRKWLRTQENIAPKVRQEIMKGLAAEEFIDSIRGTSGKDLESCLLEEARRRLDQSSPLISNNAGS